MEGDVYGYAVGGAGVLLALGQMAWSRFFGDGSAHAQLVEQQMSRITNLEARQAVLEGRVNEEMALRLAEQERASLLRRRVNVLEAVIVELGGTVPPDEYKAGGTD